MISVPLTGKQFYDVSTEQETKKVLVDMPDGGRAMIKHLKLEVVFVHKRTGDRVGFKMTGRGNYFQNGEQISEDECLSEFRRLLDAVMGHHVFRVCQFRMRFP